MPVDENEFRQSLQIIIKGSLKILGLWLLKALVSCAPAGTPILRGICIPALACAVISLFIAGILIKLYPHAKTAAAFLIEILVRSGKILDGEKHLDNLVAAGGNIIAFVFLLMVYDRLLPLITLINDSYMHFSALVTVLGVIVCLIAAGMLITAWRRAKPVFEDYSWQVADNVTRMSSGIAYRHCPSCKARNDKDAKVCMSCGAKMEPEKVLRTPPNKIRCAKCETVNMPYAKFCYQCGNNLQASLGIEILGGRCSVNAGCDGTRPPKP